MIDPSSVLAASTDIEDLVFDAVTRLADLALENSQYARPCVGHSGGKDSVLVTHLVHLVYPSVPVVHSAKVEGFNAVHPQTIRFLYGLPLVVTHYPPGYDLSKQFDLQFDGTRMAEHDRTDRSADLIVDGHSVNRSQMEFFNRRGLFNMAFVYPIYDWSDEQVWAAIWKYRIPFSEEYEHERQVLASLGTPS